MIADAAELAPPGYALVLGCGQCTEIPVRFLCQRFSQVDLLDANGAVLDELDLRYQTASPPLTRYALHRADLTGLVVRIIPEARKVVASAQSPAACLEALGEVLLAHEPRFWRPPHQESYSLIVGSVMLTQPPAAILKAVGEIFQSYFPAEWLERYKPWKKVAWQFSRQVEKAFIAHLADLLQTTGVVYLSETVHVCWLSTSPAGDGFSTEGSWILTESSKLADYLPAHYEIIDERSWEWLDLVPEGGYQGRLYGVQGISYRIP